MCWMIKAYKRVFWGCGHAFPNYITIGTITTPFLHQKVPKNKANEAYGGFLVWSWVNKCTQ